MMQKLGLALVAVGFLLAAVVATLDKEAIDWTYFLPALGIGVAGVVVARRAASQHATDADVLAANIREISSSIDAISEQAARLAAVTYEESVYDLPQEIDDTFPDLLSRFVEARESIAHVHGVQAYADIMSDFAAGERYLNRVWSAAAEGYVDEVAQYLSKARAEFERARDKVQALTKRS